jgi:hypothetical protein
MVQKQKPTMAIHLGDIYYGGIAAECETFVQLWPFQTNTRNPLIGIPPKTSLELNGNHEMYSGGDAYFNVVLKAFGQSQPFFCLGNEHWRLIGLDTAICSGTSETKWLRRSHFYPVELVGGPPEEWKEEGEHLPHPS